jgi:hypothetical protein
MSSQSIPETADAHRLRTPDQPQGQIASSADTLRFAWGLASSTLGPIQMLCPWVFRALHDSPASEDFLGVRNALILPGQMNSYFWGPILASLPHLRPVQLGHGAVQVTLEVSLMAIQLLRCVRYFEALRLNRWLGCLIEPLQLQATEATEFAAFSRPPSAMPSLLRPIHRFRSQVDLRGAYK